MDIARLKAEYAAQGFKARGGPHAASRGFGSIRLLNRLGSLTPDLSNAIASSGLAKRVVPLNIDPRRSLPPFEKSLKRRWGPARTASSTNTPRARFFGDRFTMFNEPGIGLATNVSTRPSDIRSICVMRACRGRAKISLGLLDQAIEEVDVTIERLTPLINDDSIKAILVAEPSCLSAMKDDWLALKLRTPLELRRKLASSGPSCPRTFWRGSGIRIQQGG